MTEKFINFQFLVPFPQFNLTIMNEYKQNAKQLSEISTMKSLFCDFDFPTNFNKNYSFFNVDWLLQLLANETNLIQAELNDLQSETEDFRNPEKEQFNGRQKQTLPVAALAMASIGLFGGGVILGGGNNCRLAGIFGKSEKKTENFLRLAEFVEEVTADVHRLRQDTNEKIFMVSRGLSELKKTQDEIIQIQNQNWKTIEEQFEMFEN